MSAVDAATVRESEKLYGDRKPWKLEPFYSRHMVAMTAEGLHSKSAIAEELAFRDQRIAMLESANAAANALIGESADEKAELDRKLQAAEGPPIEAEWTPAADPPPENVWIFFWMPRTRTANKLMMPLHIGYRHGSHWVRSDGTSYHDDLVSHWRHLFEPPEGLQYP